MVGISVYLGLEDYSLESNIEYIKLANEIGIKDIFTSVHMPEMSNRVFSELHEILKLTDQLSMRVTVDISKPMFSKIDLLQYNIDTLRLDYGFNDDDIVSLSNSKHFRLELNASTLNKEKINKLKKLGLNVDNINVSHNFYPKKYTGLDYSELIKKNEFYKTQGFRIIAFIPSQCGKRGPVYEGLPTIEEHRFQDPFISVQELYQAYVDDVYFGDAFAGIDELKTVVDVRPDIITFPIKLEQNVSEDELNIIEKTHVNRNDESGYFKRSSSYRCKEQIIEPNNIKERVKGSVTIDNYKYKRYQGELQIIKRDLEADDKVNVVGSLIDCDRLITCLKPGKKFRFKVVGGSSYE